MASQDWFDKDFYAILGLPQDADDKAVKKAYRTLARKYHPDQNPGDTVAEEKFKEVTEAHQVLSDPEQRKQYDAIRQMAHGGARFAPGSGAGGGFEDLLGQMFGGQQQGGPRVRFDTGGPRPGGAPNFEDILGGIFAQQGGGYGGYGAPSGPRKGRDVEARTTLTFRDAVAGSTITLQTPDGERVTTRIPAGVKDGQRIRLRGKGSAGDPGMPSGDLMLHVTVTPDPVWGRDGDNLTIEVPVTFSEAALGAQVSVPTLDGGQVTVRVPAGTPSGRVLRIKGRGVQTKSGSGDLHATITVRVPQELTDEARAAIEQLRDNEKDTDPRADLFRKARG